MPEETRKDFFISYNQADRFWAEWIADLLEGLGYRTIYQHRDFPDSLTAPQRDPNFISKMHQAIKNSRCTLALLSPGYLTSRFCENEWTAAFHLQTLQPVRVQVCDVPGLLAPLGYIDLVDLEEDQAREALLSQLGQSPGPATIPPFPGGRAAPPAFRFPGDPPPVWGVPHLRNYKFTGREDYLERVHQTLSSGQGLAALTQAIAGLGGVGKTQVALEYAYRYAPEYERVWWVRAEGAVSLAEGYAALARELNLQEKDAQDQGVVKEAVRRALGLGGKWLLIFDNAEDPRLVQEYLPPRGGHALITSRSSHWSDLAPVVELQVWPPEEAEAFILKRTGSQDEDKARELAQELGYLPLALEQAGAYITAAKTNLRDYLQLFQNRRRELWDHEKPPSGYPDTVATTWDISFKRLQQESPQGADLLNLCAFLAPDDIPKELLAQGAEHLPPRLARVVNDPLALNAALAALRRYSLLEVGGDALAVHRLVQAVVRDRLDNIGKKKWAGAAVEVVNAAFPPGNFDVKPETWTWCGRLLPHALEAGGHTEALLVALPAVTQVLNQAGIYFYIRAEFREASKVLERALLLDEAAYGSDHPTVANRLNNLGTVLQALGDLAGAKVHFERALAIVEAVHGPEHPTVAGFANNLGYVLCALGYLEVAKVHFERALAIDEAAYGPNHPEVARDVNNLGSVLRGLRDLAGARVYFERALAIVKAVHGPEHPTVAICTNNLGGVLKELGDLMGAKAHYERALAIDEAAYGPKHPQVAIRVNNLGSVLAVLGDLKGTKALVERALVIDEETYGLNHPMVASRLNNLGFVLQAQGNLEGAKAHYERALRIYRQFLGEDHPRTQNVKNNLASLGFPENKR